MNPKHILVIIILLLMCGTASAAVIECINCSDCNEKIQSASIGDIVRLTADITDFDGTCIDFADKDGIVFDGSGHTIDGIDSYSYYGIYLPRNSDHNAIKNCTITDFRAGIYLYHASHNAIQNITAYSNRESGITLLYGDHNTICDCLLEENGYYDFHFRPNGLGDCDNILINITGSGGRSIGYYNQNVDLHDLEFSALYLCDADDSTLDNILIKGSDNKRNNGMRLYFTNDSILMNITSSNNSNGINLGDSHHNIIKNVVCKYNRNSAIFTRESSHNTIEDTVTSSGSQCGIYLFHSPDNVLTNVTTKENSFAGVYIDGGESTIINDSHISNNYCGLNIGSDYNLIYNNKIFDNQQDVDFAKNVDHDTYTNTWNITPTTGTNIVGRPYFGGNYWGNYTGNDTDGDGLGDQPYSVIGDINIDYHPLTILICGDVDCNGYVSANDVVETYRRAVDPNHPLMSVWAADVDGNGYVSANDVVEIYRRAVNPDHPLNCI